MNYLVLVLRLIHIVGGVFWVGGAVIMHFFVGPAVSATAEAGQKVVHHLINKAHLSQRIAAAGMLTVLAGAWLYWIDSDGLTSAWMKSGAGIGFTIGALFAFVGLGTGMMNGAGFRALAKLGSQIEGQPTAEQIGQLQAIQKRQAVVGPLSTYSLIAAVIFMALARYLSF